MNALLLGKYNCVKKRIELQYKYVLQILDNVRQMGVKKKVEKRREKKRRDTG